MMRAGVVDEKSGLQARFFVGSGAAGFSSPEFLTVFQIVFIDFFDQGRALQIEQFGCA